MSRSNAPREQLLKPWHLAVAVIGFAVAFIWIAPGKQSLSLQDAQLDSGISELDLAYLKAERASSKSSNEDVLKAATALVREQRIAEAEQLLADNPDVRMSHSDELAFSLERSMVRFNEELAKENSDETLVNQHKNAAIITINDLYSASNITRVDVLSRSYEVAIWFDQHAMAAGFAQRLSGLDSKRAAQWYRHCVSSSVMVGEYEQAMECATRQSALAATDEERFDAQTNELNVAFKLNNYHRVEELFQPLLVSPAASVPGLTSLAELLLANERPLEAARTYAKLAEVDKTEQTAHWYKQAARWSEAGGKLKESADYLSLARNWVNEDEQDKVDDKIASLLTASGNRGALLDRSRKKIAQGDRSLATLSLAVKHAMGTGDTVLSKQWNDLLVRNHPEVLEGWVNQYNISLGESDTQGALSAARTLVDLQPKSAEHRMRLAQVAEWSGDPDLATAEWLWLSERYPTLDSLTELTRLSTLTLRPNLTAEALRKRAMLKKPTQEEVSQLLTAYELEGTPNQAAKVLEVLLDRYGPDVEWMRLLAELHARHEKYVDALAVWDRFEDTFQPYIYSSLQRMEMLWRIQEPEKSKNVAISLVDLVGDDARVLDKASDYQIRLIAELGWRYDLPQLNNLVQFQLTRIESDSQQLLYRVRSIDSEAKDGRIQRAVEAAGQLQADEGTLYSSLLHMRLLLEAIKTDSENAPSYDSSFQPYLQGNSDTIELRQDAGYWELVAQYHVMKGNIAEAKTAYDHALEQSPNNPDYLANLLWMYMGENDQSKIREFLDQRSELIEKSSTLWTPVAVAYNQIGMPKESLRWFSRQLDTIDTDYGLLLTYADALDAAGQSNTALKVRNYAINAIRPLLVEGAAEDQDELLRQYASVVSLYGTTDQKERFAQGVLDDSNAGLIKQDKFWQQEMAISWLMATQRHDMARVVLAKLHEQRLEAPAWQALAVAMKQNDLDTVAEIVQSGQGISIGDNMLALRKLGRSNDAFSVAVNALHAGLSGVDGEMAAQTYRALRQHRPAFAGASFNSTVGQDLSILESSVLARHTFKGSTFGIALNATQRQFDSVRYRLTDADDLSDIAVTLHYGDAGFNSRLTAGYLADTAVNRTYFSGGITGQLSEGKHGYDLEVALGEAATASTLLQLRGKQDRASATVNFSIGKMAFARFNVNAVDIATRVSERKVARGISTMAEFGLRGSMGSHNWSTSVVASTEVNDRTDLVPEELNLNDQVSLSEIIGDKASTLSLGASLSRGGIAGNYPQVNSPRYFINMRAGHRWPERNFGLQVQAGAGMRIIGGDELSVGLSHDGLVNSLVDEGRSRIGMNYRYHF